MMVLASSAMDFFASVLSVIAGVGALAGAVAVITANRVFRAVLGLLVTVVCLSIEYVLLAAPVIAFIQILVYAGAVVVLFLFVVMLLDLKRQTPETTKRGPVAWEWAVGSAGTLLVVGISAIRFFGVLPPPAAPPTRAAIPPPPPEAVGTALFTDYLVSFEAVAVFLLAAVVVALYLAHPRTPGEKSDPSEATDPDPAQEGGPAPEGSPGKEAS